MPNTPDRILVVDDEDAIRELLVSQVNYMGHQCSGASSAAEGLAAASTAPYPALVLSDVEMPGLSGIELLNQLHDLDENIQVIMVTANLDMGTIRQCLKAGAYDYVTKPYDLQDLSETIERALERRRLRLEVQDYQRDLERKVQEKTREVLETRDIALLAVAKLAECRDDSTGFHLDRMQWYSRILAEQIAAEGPYSQVATPEFVEHLFKSSPLHDIGKVAIPDAILLKDGSLSEQEWIVMRTHTTRGGDTLREVIDSHRSPKGQGARFLRMAMEIAYDHHEKWDGSGYPYGKSSESIPLGARIVSLADAYDAITSDRPYKSALSHETAYQRIETDRGSHFDPILVTAFQQCHKKFELIQKQMKSSLGTAPPHASALRSPIGSRTTPTFN